MLASIKRKCLLWMPFYVSTAISLAAEDTNQVRPAGNLFCNPSFELGTDQWKMDVAGKTAARLAVDRADAADGHRSAILTIDAVDSWGVQFGQTMSAPQPGKTYTFAVLARSTKGRLPLGLEIECPAPPWNRVARGPTVIVGPGAWMELHLTFKVERTFPEGWFAYVSCSESNVEFRLDMFRLYEGEYVPFRPRAESAETVPALAERLVLDVGGGINMDFILLRPGSFTMGDASGKDDEKPVHLVKITKPFYLGKYPVTQQQWEAVMGNNPSHFKGPQNPVDQVSWEDCQAFLQKINERFSSSGEKFGLPTEAQWEYACRTGSTADYFFGDAEERLGDYAWFDGNSGYRTHPVGEKRPNSWGLHDMHGNVWQWCADPYDPSYYERSPVDDPTGPVSGSNRVLRGGSWAVRAFTCRDSYRAALSPKFRHWDFGLRVALVRE